MAAITYGVTEKGFVRKPLSVIIDSLNSRFTAAFGSTFDVSPESPDGQVIGIVGNEISLLWEQGQYAFNSYRPGAVEGVGLDSVCELTNTRRYVNKPTQVTVLLGTNDSEGTVVPAGIRVGDASGHEFITQDEVTLPGDVTAICTTVGEIYIAPNTVTKILTENVQGLDYCNNPEEGQTGINYEQDTALRARRDRTTISSGTATVEAIYDAVADLDLEYIRVRDNDTAQPIGEQPANTIWVVVDGGTVNDIARKIYENKAGGVPTYGNISVVLKDSKGYPKTIKFSRTTKVPVFFHIIVRRLPTSNLSSNDVKYSVQDAVQTYIDSLKPGAPVVWSYVIPQILAATSGIQIDDLSVGLSSSTVGKTTLVMDINQRPTTVTANIVVVDATNT